MNAKEKQEQAVHFEYATIKQVKVDLAKQKIILHTEIHLNRDNERNARVAPPLLNIDIKIPFFPKANAEAGTDKPEKELAFVQMLSDVHCHTKPFFLAPKNSVAYNHTAYCVWEVRQVLLRTWYRISIDGESPQWIVASHRTSLQPPE